MIWSIIATWDVWGGNGEGTSRVPGTSLFIGHFLLDESSTPPLEMKVRDMGGGDQRHMREGIPVRWAIILCCSISAASGTGAEKQTNSVASCQQLDQPLSSSTALLWSSDLSSAGDNVKANNKHRSQHRGVRLGEESSKCGKCKYTLFLLILMQNITPFKLLFSCIIGNSRSGYGSEWFR